MLDFKHFRKNERSEVIQFSNKIIKHFLLYLSVALHLIAHVKERGVGKKLLTDSLKRCAKQAEQIGACAAFVEPEDINAQDFYLKFGYYKFEHQQKMFIPIKQLVTAFSGFH